MTVRIAQVEVAAPIVLILDIAVDDNAAAFQFGAHRVDIVDIDIKCPVLVERNRMRRAHFIEKDRHSVAIDDAKRRRLAVKDAGAKPGPDSVAATFEPTPAGSPRAAVERR